MTRRWRWLRRTPSGSCASSWPPRRTSRRRSCSPRTRSSTRSIQPGKLTRSSFWNSPKWVWNDLDSREIFNIKYPWRRVHSWRKLYSECLTRTAAATSTSPSLCRWGWTRTSPGVSCDHGFTLIWRPTTSRTWTRPRPSWAGCSMPTTRTGAAPWMLRRSPASWWGSSGLIFIISCPGSHVTHSTLQAGWYRGGPGPAGRLRVRRDRGSGPGGGRRDLQGGVCQECHELQVYIQHVEVKENLTFLYLLLSSRHQR